MSTVILRCCFTPICCTFVFIWIGSAVLDVHFPSHRRLFERHNRTTKQIWKMSKEMIQHLSGTESNGERYKPHNCRISKHKCCIRSCAPLVHSCLRQQYDEGLEGRIVFSLIKPCFFFSFFFSFSCNVACSHISKSYGQKPPCRAWTFPGCICCNMKWNQYGCHAETHSGTQFRFISLPVQFALSLFKKE